MLEGVMEDQHVRVFKDDGCNINAISKEFVNKNRIRFKIISKRTNIKHSKKSSSETSDSMASNGTLQIRNRKYTSNWILTDLRYDVIIGMPWHRYCNPKTKYSLKKVKVECEILSNTAVAKEEAANSIA